VFGFLQGFTGPAPKTAGLAPPAAMASGQA
jgi:hypothetical protein